MKVLLFVIKEKPYHLILLHAIVFLIVYGILNNSTDRIFIQGEEYQMKSFTDFLRSSSIVSIICWLVYLLYRKHKFSRKLIWAHIIFSFLSSLCYVSSILWLMGKDEGTATAPRSFLQDSYQVFKMYNKLLPSTILNIVLFMTALAVFVLNIMISVYVRRRRIA